jgi:molecular chaperone DnaK
MVSDAKAHGAEDIRKREEVEAKNRADQLVYETEKNLSEMGDKISADDRAKVEAAISRTKQALGGSNVDEIKASTDALMQVAGQAAQAAYQQAAQAGAGAGAGPQAGPGEGAQGQAEGGKDNAVDADYEVVD